MVHAAMRNIWERWSVDQGNAGRDDSLHRRLTRCFENFGASWLTDREREITQLLLRGHSAKSVARELKIAPGTVMVHKRNLFTKLGITSQYELFSRFIDELSRS
jgi:DNA-binding CsgD family transcriptional regulator